MCDGRSAEAQAAGDHAQHGAVGVDQRAAGEARVKDGVDLDEAFEHAAATRAGRAGQAGDQAQAGVGLSARPADNQRQGADAWVALGGRGGRERARARGEFAGSPGRWSGRGRRPRRRLRSRRAGRCGWSLRGKGRRRGRRSGRGRRPGRCRRRVGHGGPGRARVQAPAAWTASASWFERLESSDMLRTLRSTCAAIHPPGG